jgi:hypothetical protein
MFCCFTDGLDLIILLLFTEQLSYGAHPLLSVLREMGELLLMGIMIAWKNHGTIVCNERQGSYCTPIVHIAYCTPYS